MLGCTPSQYTAGTSFHPQQSRQSPPLSVRLTDRKGAWERCSGATGRVLLGLKHELGMFGISSSHLFERCVLDEANMSLPLRC